MNIDTELIFNQIFRLMYFSLSFVVVYFLIEQSIKGLYHKKQQRFFLFLFSFSFILLFGIRGIKVGVDTENTLSYFTGDRVVSNLNDVKDIGIFLVSKFTLLFTNDINIFLTLLATLYIVPILMTINRITKQNRLLLFFVFVSFFFFKSMGINTMRQGIAASFFLLGFTYYRDRKYLSVIILYSLAFISHASIIVVISISILSRLPKTIKWPILVYVSAALLSLFNIGIYNTLTKIPIVNILVEDRLMSYVQDISYSTYRTGFRLDFFIFNTFFAYLGYLVLNKKKVVYFDRAQYLGIYISYLLSSSLFFLMFSATYSDRFGFLSWLFIPLLLVPYIQGGKSIGLLNTYSISALCFIIFIIFNFAL